GCPRRARERPIKDRCNDRIERWIEGLNSLDRPCHQFHGGHVTAADEVGLTDSVQSGGFERSAHTGSGCAMRVLRISPTASMRGNGNPTPASAPRSSSPAMKCSKSDREGQASYTVIPPSRSTLICSCR